MTGFALHRIVLDEDRSDIEHRSTTSLQFQVSVDGGETWYGVVTSGGIELKASKEERMKASVQVPIFEFDEGRFGSIVEGKIIEYEA
jgi:hypothetical protein